MKRLRAVDERMAAEALLGFSKSKTPSIASDVPSSSLNLSPLPPVEKEDPFFDPFRTPTPPPVPSSESKINSLSRYNSL